MNVLVPRTSTYYYYYLKCTYLSDTVTRNAAAALCTVSDVPAYNTGGNSELAASGPENSGSKEMFSVLVLISVSARHQLMP